MNLTENFKLEEFRSRDSFLFPLHVINNLYDLAVELQKLRVIIGKPILINSGYRTAAHNAAVGGSPNSQHLLGKAADIWIKDMEPHELHHIINGLIHDGLMKQGGLGLYDTFVHYDIRGHKARWDFRTKT